MWPTSQVTRGGSAHPEAGERHSGLRSPAHNSAAGRGRTRGANCDARVQRTQCAGALGGDSTVSGSAVLFLVNEAAEQVGGSVRAGSRRIGVEREVRGRGSGGDGPNRFVRVRLRGSAKQRVLGQCFGPQEANRPLGERLARAAGLSYLTGPRGGGLVLCRSKLVGGI